MIDRIKQDNYMIRKVLRELIILRKLSELECNIFTTKVFDVIFPPGIVQENMSADDKRL